jgi:predicted phosphate transport protein (TIGR00153 family)
MAASKTLREAMEKGPNALREAEVSIARMEQKCDDIAHEIFTRLNQTFITPLDPEDIYSLGSHLDDVMDGIEEAAHKIVAYRIDPVPPAMIELATLIEACAASLQKAFEALNAGAAMLDHLIEVNRFEGKADHLARASVADLFTDGADPITVIKFKEIYDCLELTTDYCEDVADALQNVVVKNG